MIKKIKLDKLIEKIRLWNQTFSLSMALVAAAALALSACPGGSSGNGGGNGNGNGGQSSDATLSALSITPGSLNEPFASDTTTYTASVANTVTSVTVTATTADSGATVRFTPSATVSLNVGANPITVSVTAADGTTMMAYTVTVTRAVDPNASSDATLSALSLSNGITLAPSFSPAETTYIANAATSVTSTTVTATPTDSGATVSISGTNAADVALPPVSSTNEVSGLTIGANVLTILVTAEDDTTTETYTVTVRRAVDPGASSDATLSALSIDPGTLTPTFTSPEVTTYTASVTNAISSTTVTATATDTSGATVSITPRDADAGTDGHQVSLNIGDNTITILVTAEDGTTTETYTVTVTRGVDASLSALSLSGGITLDPSFSPAETMYTANAANSVTSTTVTATPNDPAATVRITPSATVSLNVGAAITITILVTAANGTTTETYTVTVTRADPSASSVATLSALSLSQGTLDPAFSSAEMTYTAMVTNTINSTTVTATATDSGATVSITPRDADAGTDGHQAPLNVGANPITVLVTAADGMTTETYTVTVTRAVSSDATLSSLSLSPREGELDPLFVPGTTSYDADVPYATGNNVTVTATPTNDSATVVITAANAQGTILTVSPANVVMGLTVGSNATNTNTITITVTAEDTTTERIYTVDVTRIADVSLSALTLTDIGFAFTPETLVYNLNAANSVAITTVTATAASSDATVSIPPGTTVSLNVGANTITVTVTATDTTTREYTVNVTRAAPSTSSNAVLSALTIDPGTLDPTFSSAEMTYTAMVASTVSSVTVTATAADSAASIAISGTDSRDGDNALPGGITAMSSATTALSGLTVGDNTITIVVTAEDGMTRETYTVTVNRAGTVAIWLTSNTHAGNFLSGAGDADAICAADSNRRTGAGDDTHRALISRAGNHPRDFAGVPLDGTVHFDDGFGFDSIDTTYRDFFDSTKSAGENLSFSGGSPFRYWTGFTNTLALGGNAETCNGWTSNSSTVQGTVGLSFAADVNRLHNSPARSCNQPRRFLCASYKAIN